MGRIKDLSGQKFNEWTVIKDSGERRNREVMWLCKCSCGTEKLVRGSDLRKGKSKSCGCLTDKESYGILEGTKQGHLSIIERLPSGKYLCKCDCGNIKEISRDILTRSKVQTCGSNDCSYHIKEKIDKAPVNDLTGRRFGKLLVLEKTDKRSCEGNVIWKCRCDCGNIKEIRSRDLLSNHTISCGCLTQSKGEFFIEKILKENNIPFEKEVKFESCIFPSTNAYLRFDFYINNEYIIEFDGEQHFHATNWYWNDEDSFKKTKERDEFKNQWCKDNNIPLIRIPYTHLNKITLNDLKLEESKFII